MRCGSSKSVRMCSYYWACNAIVRKHVSISLASRIKNRLTTFKVKFFIFFRGFFCVCHWFFNGTIFAFLSWMCSRLMQNEEKRIVGNAFIYKVESEHFRRGHSIIISNSKHHKRNHRMLNWLPELRKFHVANCKDGSGQFRNCLFDKLKLLLFPQTIWRSIKWLSKVLRFNFLIEKAD